MSKQISTKKRTLLFVAFGWVLLILGDRVGDLELYQGSFVATYALAITSIILLLSVYCCGSDNLFNPT